MEYKYRVTKSYDYNALCDVCQFKFKASELKQRWDGLWCCKDDWEIRHPLDFYRTRNDTHKLPFTRSNDGIDPTLQWTPTWNGTVSLRNGETITIPIVQTGYYIANTTDGLTKFELPILFSKVTQADNSILAVVSDPQSVTSSSGSTIALPTTPTGAGTAVVRTSQGKFLGTAAIAAGNITLTLPSWTSKQGHVYISGSYIT